ncbi:MAG: SulP family inorganic anion transporter [Enterobacteriaceae bacterium]
MAALSIAGLLLPEAVAYARIANLPAHAGIISLFAGLLCYGLIGSSRFAIVSATSSSAAVLAAATFSIAGGDESLRLLLAIGMLLVTSGFFILAAVLRLGNITNFIARPVLRGFAFGLAIVIICRQLADIFGVHTQHRDLLRFVPEVVAQFSQWNTLSIMIALVALLLLLLCSRIKYMPGGLIVIALGIALTHWINLEAYQIVLVGQIDMQIQTPIFPSLNRDQWLRLGELGFAMALILYCESYGAIRNFAAKHGDSISPNRDLFALGIANLCSALFHGQPVGAGYSATAANEAAGAKSRCSGLIAALFILLIVLTLLPVIALTPVPVLAAIVIHAVGHTLNPQIFRNTFAWRRDRLITLSAIIGVLLFGILDGLLLAIALSLLMLLKSLASSSLSELGKLENSHDFVRMVTHPSAKRIDGIAIFRPEQPLFFANVDRVLHHLRQQTMAMGDSVQTVIVSLEESPDLDSSTLENLQELFQFFARRQQRLILTRLKAQAFQALSCVVPADSRAVQLSDLSVDHAVKVAQDKLP